MFKFSILISCCINSMYLEFPIEIEHGTSDVLELVNETRGNADADVSPRHACTTSDLLRFEPTTTHDFTQTCKFINYFKTVTLIKGIISREHLKDKHVPRIDMGPITANTSWFISSSILANHQLGLPSITMSRRFSPTFPSAQYHNFL